MRSWKRGLLAAVVGLIAGCGGGGGDGGGGDEGDEVGGAGLSREERRARANETPGRRLYRQACIMCHGEGGRGTQLGPALAGAAGGGQQVATVVRDGVAASDSFPVPMPPRGDGTFSDEQIQTVSEYVGSLAR